MSDVEIIAGLLLVIILTLVLGMLILSRNLHILGRKSALDTTSENYSLLKINNFPHIPLVWMVSSLLPVFFIIFSSSIEPDSL